MEPEVEKINGTISTQDGGSQAEKLFVRGYVNEQMPTFKETLTNFGLLRKEINVYLHLAITGSKKAKEISEAIAINRTETYCAQTVQRTQRSASYSCRNRKQRAR